jgi:hypothetical protein
MRLGSLQDASCSGGMRADGALAVALGGPAADIMRVRGLHLSGADEQGPRDAVVMAVDCTKTLWLLRFNGDP